eukprot:GHVU01204686.1.p3 GENE.GHVU01204686.1~~GHVU01204686.1.p3  ORF type:complete len:150 (-),score=28.74 GHVU01204686.1:2533-2982(-)
MALTRQVAAIAEGEGERVAKVPEDIAASTPAEEWGCDDDDTEEHAGEAIALPDDGDLPAASPGDERYLLCGDVSKDDLLGDYSASSSSSDGEDSDNDYADDEWQAPMPVRIVAVVPDSQAGSSRRVATRSVTSSQQASQRWGLDETQWG